MICLINLFSFHLFLSSGIPVQLDRFLPVFLFDHLSSRPLRGHLRVWPLPHQMDPHSPGTRSSRRTQTQTLLSTYKHIKCGFMYAQTTQKPQTPLWYFNVVSVVVSVLALHYFLKDLLRTLAAFFIPFFNAELIWVKPLQAIFFLTSHFCRSVGFLVLHILPWLLWWTVLAVVGVPGVGWVANLWI